MAHWLNRWNNFWNNVMPAVGNGFQDGWNWLVSQLPSSKKEQANRDFTEAQNQINRDREDTAYTRAATDLQNAGLSKTLAAGSPSPTAAMSAYTSPNTTPELSNMIDMIGLSIEKEKADASVENTKAQTALTKAQTEATTVQTGLNQLDLDYYTSYNLSPAQNNKYLQLVNGIISEVKGWFLKDDKTSNWVEPAVARSVPYTESSNSSSSPKPHLNMADSANLAPALASPSYDTEFRETYPIEKRMVGREEATFAAYDRGMADWDTLELNWMAIGPAVMDEMMKLPDSFTEHLHYDEDSCHMYLDNGDYVKLAPKMFADLRDNLMIANGWNEAVAETMIKYALIYGVKNRMW